VLDRVKTAFNSGPVAGVYTLIFHILEMIFMIITEFIWPESEIDVIRPISYKRYSQGS